MRYVGWRLLSIVLTFVAALVLPLIALVVATGLVRTGPPGVIAFGVWVVVVVVLARVWRRRRRR